MDRDDFLKLFAEDRWSNAACMGYVIKACQASGYPDAEISELLKALNTVFSNFTLEEAKRIYMDF